MSYFDITSKSLAPNEKARTKTLKIGADILSIHANLKNINSGILKVYQSQNNKLFETDNDVFDVSGGKNHKQVPVKGRYAYIEFENGDQTNEIILSGKLSDENVSVGVTYQDCLMYARKDNGVVQNLKIDNDGKLLVSSSGGGSDVNVTNFPAIQDVSGSVSVNNFPETQDTRDVSAVELLSYIRDNVFSIDEHLTTYAKSTLHLDHETQGTTTWGDSTLPWLVPANGEQGWQYINSTAGGAQLYYYANTDLVNGGAETNIQLGSVSGQYFLANNKLITTVYQSKFLLGIYTKPQFDGNDAQPWYRSRKVWTVGNNKVVSKGVDYLFYRGSSPADVYPEHQLIEMTLASTNGPCSDTEIVQFMGVNVDSSAEEDAFNGVVKMAGFSSTSGEHREVVFDNSREKEANDAIKQLSFIDDGYGNKELRVLVRNPSDIGVSVNNQPTVGLAAFTSVGITEGSVVGLASGSQVALVSGTEVALASGTTVGVSGDVTITSATALSVTETAPITGFALETTQQDVYARLHDVTGNVGITGSVQTHCFASSNGTDWHHLASDANGRIITLSRTHDGLGNDITSTVNGAKRGLDVSLIDEVVVTKSYNVNTVANNVSVTGPQQIGTAVEIGGFQNIGVQIDIASVSSPANIYMEFSIDNNQYVRFSSDMTTSYYAMSAMAQQIGGIKVSNSPFRYIRLYADTGLAATGCTIKVITK